MDALFALQTDAGAFQWLPGTGDNLLATMEVIPALAERSFPWQSPTLVAAQKAVGWIKGQQEADGSFPSAFDHAAGMTLDAIFAGVAAGEDVLEWRAGVGDPSAVEYLESVVSEYAENAGSTGKLVAGVVAVGEDPEAFGGEDLVARLKGYDDGTGVYAADANGQIGAGAITHLEGMQQPGGGWGGSWGSDVDTTSIVLEALIGAGVPVDADAIMRRVDAGTPVDDLMSFQIGSGAFVLEPGGDANLFATVQAVPALLMEIYPLSKVAVAPAWFPLVFKSGVH